MGDATETLNVYIKDGIGNNNETDGYRNLERTQLSDGGGGVKFLNIQLNSINGNKTSIFYPGDPIVIQIEGIANEYRKSIVFGFSIKTCDGLYIQTSASDDVEKTECELKKGRFSATAVVSPNLLRDGTYFLQIGCTANRNEVCAVISEAIQFTITDVKSYSNTSIQGLPGLIHIPYNWKIQYDDN
jgi:hypothetical protein